MLPYNGFSKVFLFVGAIPVGLFWNFHRLTLVVIRFISRKVYALLFQAALFLMYRFFRKQSGFVEVPYFRVDQFVVLK